MTVEERVFASNAETLVQLHPEREIKRIYFTMKKFL
uniref:Uncharacterized protein n=1 Tax=Arundo donax TaxID=35708 RepID=A0A0A9F0R5_ARUDO